MVDLVAVVAVSAAVSATSAAVSSFFSWRHVSVSKKEIQREKVYFEINRLSDKWDQFIEGFSIENYPSDDALTKVIRNRSLEREWFRMTDIVYRISALSEKELGKDMIIFLLYSEMAEVAADYPNVLTDLNESTELAINSLQVWMVAVMKTQPVHRLWDWFRQRYAT